MPDRVTVELTVEVTGKVTFTALRFAASSAGSSNQVRLVREQRAGLERVRVLRARAGDVGGVPRGVELVFLLRYARVVLLRVDRVEHRLWVPVARVQRAAHEGPVERELRAVDRRQHSAGVVRVHQQRALRDES